ncbi:MAG TPA: FtsX-like permease family protein [Acidimicrobiia bacterium]|nr:FtsX-like permease family protein [Acidimicrobiia bacterium]
MWKVTRRGLLAHKLRFLLTALAVVLGVAFVSGTFVLTATIRHTFDDLFGNIYKGTDAVVRSHAVMKSDFGGDLRPRVPATLLDTVLATPGVADAHGGVAIPYAQIVDANGKAVGSPGQGPPTLGFAWNPVGKLNPFHLVPGSRAPETSDEVVVDRGSAQSAHLHVGDRITVLTQKPPKVYTLVGVARFGTADSLAGASIVLFTQQEAQRLANAIGQYDQISVAAKPGVSQQQLKSNLQQTLPAGYEAVTGKEITKENQNAVAKQLGFFNTALLVFALVALIVGVFIIYNTFSIVVAQRLREMALLRAIGASQGQVLGSVIGEAVVVGLIASAIGVIGGVFLAVGLTAALNAIGVSLPTTTVTVPANGVIIGMSVGLIITVIAAVFPAVRAARIPPVAAMRDVALERPVNRVLRSSIGGAIAFLGCAALFRGLFGGSGIASVGIGALLVLVGVFVLSPLFARGLARAIGVPLTKIKGITGSLSRENAARNPRRTATTAAAVMIAVSLVGFITIFASSANASISSAIDAQLKTDYIITSGSGFGSGMSPVLAQQIAKLPEVQAVTPIRFAPVKIAGTGTGIVAADPVASSQLFDFGAVDGSFSAMGPNSIAVSKQKADSHHWKLGDVIPVTWVKTGTVPMRLDFIYKDTIVAGNYLTTLTAFEKNATDQLDLQIFAKLKPGVSADAGRKAIEPLLKPFPTAKLQDNAQYKADQKAQVNRILALVYVLLFLAVIIALIGIANTLTLSVYERTREVGLLRAVGMSRRQVRTTVRWEAVIIALLGTLLGLVIAYFFAWAVVTSLKDQGFTKFSAAPGSVIVIVLLFSLLAVLMAILPARRAAKLDVLKAIATE